MNAVGWPGATLFGLLVGITLWPGIAASACADETVRSEVELSTKDIGNKETALGDLIADALRAEARSDAAFIAASSFTDIPPLPKGSVTGADILKALEYGGDDVVVVKLTGDQVRRALEHGLYLYPKFNSAFLQVSGLVVTLNNDAAREERIVSVKIAGEPLQAGKVYKVAMPAPLANGALAYFKIWKKSDMDKDTGKTLEAALHDYLADHKTIAKGEERLVVKSK